MNKKDLTISISINDFEKIKLNIKEGYEKGLLKEVTLQKIVQYLNLDTEEFKLLKKVEFVVKKCLRSLTNDMFLKKVGQMYVMYPQEKILRGTLRGNVRGFAFLKLENGQEYFVPPIKIEFAIHGDEVICEKEFYCGKEEARVVKIVNRPEVIIPGTIVKNRKEFYFSPDGSNYYNNFYISSVECCDISKIKNRDKVFARVNSDFSNMESVTITEVLGEDGLKTEEKLVLFANKLPVYFPNKVTKEVKEIPEEISENDLLGRENYENKKIITIDGDDSKDFDDAISVEKLPNGNFELGVYIADVSHYVNMNTELDKEAYRRSFSVYFPQSVNPMLPEKLCDNLCSLVEGKTRLTLSIIMEIDKLGNVISRNIKRSYIKSSHRMTYSKVQKILDGDSELIKEYEDIVPLINNAKELTDILVQKRNERGYINLSSKELIFNVDNDRITEISYLDDYYSRIIIEMFMITANEEIAKFVCDNHKEMVFRVHGEPTEEKIARLVQVLNCVGVKEEYNFDDRSGYISLLENSANKEYNGIINDQVLRTMLKAEYSINNIGHYGLGLQYYSHFTSPIRRYSDLLVHRIVKCILDGKIFDDNLNEKCEYISKKELEIQSAEREIQKIYQCFYMQPKIGKSFTGIISSIVKNGFFVTLDNGVETFVSSTDYYDMYIDIDKFVVYYSDEKYTLGSKVKVGLERVDISLRRIDSVLWER